MEADEFKKISDLVNAANRILAQWDTDQLQSNPRLIWAGIETVYWIQDLRKATGIVEDLCRNVSTPR